MGGFIGIVNLKKNIKNENENHFHIDSEEKTAII